MLDDSTRVTELGRMLAGLEGSSTAAAHADELLTVAAAERSSSSPTRPPHQEGTPVTEIFDLADRIVEGSADADPIMATYVGVPGRDHLLTDYSRAGERRAGRAGARLAGRARRRCR